MAFQWHIHLLVLGLVEHVGETALAAVLTVEVRGHEDSSAALLSRALTAQTVDLAIVVNLVVLEDGQLDFPVLVLDLLGGGVVLLLPLLSTSPQPEDEDSCHLAPGWRKHLSLPNRLEPQRRQRSWQQQQRSLVQYHHQESKCKCAWIEQTPFG